MAPCRPGRLNIPSMDYSSFCSSTTLTSSDLDGESVLSPRTLYAQTFDRPNTSQSLPAATTAAGHSRKNTKDMSSFLTTEEEFDALPIAVRKKYFSTLERLRFAQTSRSAALHDLPVQRNRKVSLADRRGLNTPIIETPLRGKRLTGRRLRKSAASASSDDASWFLTLPEKIRKREFTREEQVILAGRLRDSVILDAADEAILRNRRASRNLTPLFDPPSPESPIESVGMAEFETESEVVPAAFYESFRWMDEEQDLDLKLVLDDYHANLDGAVIPTPESTRRPSFRRTMSVTKMPFGRNSLTSQPRSPKFNTNHNRQASRALSLMAPKHTMHDSISSIDPNATHYQDPEARLKLRVYLASPQKFDEAIEFGFPSMDGVADDKENNPPRSNREGLNSPSAEDSGHSFLLNEIDTASLFEEDDASMLDPNSPLTPMDKDTAFRTPLRPTPPARASKTSADLTYLSVNRVAVVKRPESYSQGTTVNREMTLRMTLTRPDLRDENAIYGWQTTNSMSPLREESLPGGDNSEMRGPFGGSDGWDTSERDSGVVKRFWNKVRTQRKSA